MILSHRFDAAAHPAPPGVRARWCACCGPAAPWYRRCPACHRTLLEAAPGGFGVRWVDDPAVPLPQGAPACSTPANDSAPPSP